MARKCCLFVSVWLLVGCSLNALPAATPSAPTATLITPLAEASTPTASPTPTPTPTASPSVTPEATVPAGPTPAAPPPTPTLSAAVGDMGYCRTTFGPKDGARFSARLESLAAEQLEQVDRLTITLADVRGDVHGTAACIGAERWATLAGPDGQEAPGATLIALNLDAWAHDDAWASSPLTSTTVMGANSFERISYAMDETRSRGTVIGIGIRRTLAFRVYVEQEPARIVVEVNRVPRVDSASDPLGQALGRADLPAEPIFFLQNYDVWRFADGRARPLTTTAELETALAVSPDGTTLAMCRAPADTEPAALPYDVRATLWVMDADGNDQRLLADVGGCADLAFAPSGRTVAFTANTATVPPAVLSVWTVPVVVGDPQQATPVGDEWNRWGPQWLPDSRLIYHGSSGAGLSVLFVKDDDGSEREVSQQMLTGTRYDGIGDVVVGNDLLAVEALRAGEDGSDLVVLRFDGTEVAVEGRGFWQRPLVFEDGALLYLSTECPSEVVQQYTLLRRAADGTIHELLDGRTAAGIGEVVLLGDQVLLARSTTPRPGLRGPLALPTDTSRMSLWELEDDGAIRREIYRSPVPFFHLGVSRASNAP